MIDQIYTIAEIKVIGESWISDFAMSPKKGETFVGRLFRNNLGVKEFQFNYKGSPSRILLTDNQNIEIKEIYPFEEIESISKWLLDKSSKFRLILGFDKSWFDESYYQENKSFHSSYFAFITTMDSLSMNKFLKLPLDRLNFGFNEVLGIIDHYKEESEKGEIKDLFCCSITNSIVNIETSNSISDAVHLLFKELSK